MNKSIELSKNQYNNLNDELIHALKNTSHNDLKYWAKFTISLLPNIALRKVINLGDLLGKFAKVIYKESKDLLIAGYEFRLKSHTKYKLEKINEFSYSAYEDFKNINNLLLKLLKEDPKKAAIQIFLAAFGFNVGSGGLDGDGGIPDLDLLVSIGQHRSIITHSILPTIIIETLFLSVVCLIKIIHSNLPKNHDPIWDQIKENNEDILCTFYNGMSFGLAYHLGVDTFIDSGGTYKNLPFSMPLYGHQMIMGINSITEFVDFFKRKKKINWNNIH